MAFIIEQKSTNGRVNIHLAKSVHRPGKSPCQTRQHLGVLDTQTRELILARNQPDPSEEIQQLLTRKSIQWNGRRFTKKPQPQHSSEHASAAPAPVPSCVTIQEMGRTFLLNELARESGLSNALEHAFGERDASILLWAAMHQVCEGSPVYLLHEWMEEVCGYPCEGVSPSSIGTLLQNIGVDKLRQRDFSIAWIKACGTPVSLIHDTTSISTYSKYEEAEYGYNRDGDNLPQINLALVVARETRLPLWYRTLPGSIPDVASLKVTASLLEELGLRHFSFTLDRGYYSSKNIAELLSKEIRFCIGVPMHIKQARNLVQLHAKNLRKFENTFLLKSIPIGHVRCKFIQKKVDNSMAELDAHLYLNTEQYAQMAIQLDRAILELSRLSQNQEFKSTKEAHEWLEENTGKLRRFFGVRTLGDKASIVVKSRQIAQAKKYFGVMLLISEQGGTNGQIPDVSSDHEVVLADYRSRDIAEKIFDAYKNSQGNGRLKTGNAASVEGRVLLAFLSSILRSLLENKLQKASAEIKIGLPEVLLQLKKIRRIQPQQGSPIILEAPKKTRDILDALKLKLEDMRPLAPKAARRTADR
jgi:transposase